MSDRTPPTPESPHSNSAAPGAGLLPVASRGADWVLRQGSKKPLEAVFEWTLRSVSQLGKERVFSEYFSVGDARWRIMVFPRGASASDLSVFLALDCAGLGRHFSRTAWFSLSVINQVDASRSLHKDEEHTFSEQSDDWGFNQFAPLSVVYGESEGFVVDDAIKLEVYVRVSRDSLTPFLDYSSFKATGMVGLKNQGATCYMNSLLQTLFHTGEFRRGVYQMETPAERSERIAAEAAAAAAAEGGGADGAGAGASGGNPAAGGAKRSIPYALQRVFYRMQTSEDPVGTRELTRSFGWDSYEAFTQHDVQEFNRVLIDNLEEKMKGTATEGLVSRLFSGTLLNYIECVNVDFASRREENFFDLQLLVKGCADIYKSFEDYVEVETMDGENKYMAEGHGLQDARKGVAFLKLPPVLTLHLRRFEYDPYRNDMAKVNDRHEFYETLDLNRFIDQTEAGKDGAPDQRYHLFSVLVHAGDVGGGHYYAYVRPDPISDPEGWYKFDDDRVTRSSAEEALDENFGGEHTSSYTVGGFTHRRTRNRSANAYMLVYMREGEIPSIQRKVTREDVPVPLLECIERDQRAEEERRRERAELHLFVQARAATFEAFRDHTGHDIVDWDSLPKFKVKRDWTIRAVREHIAERAGIPADEARLWQCTSRRNRTIRPDLVVTAPAGATEDTYTLSDFLGGGSGGTRRSESLVNFVVERVPAGSAVTPLADGEVCLILRWYDPLKGGEDASGRGILGATSFVDTFVARAEDKPDVAEKHVRSVLGIDPDVPLVAYEDVSLSLVEELDLDSTFVSAQIGSGDLLVYQLESPADRSRVLNPNMIDFVRYHSSVRPCFLYDLSEAPAHSNAKSLSVSYSLDGSILGLADAVAEELGADRGHVRLVPTLSPETRVARAVDVSAMFAPRAEGDDSDAASEGVTLRDFITAPAARGADRDDAVPRDAVHLYYEVIPETLVSLRGKRKLTVRWLDIESISREEAEFEREEAERESNLDAGEGNDSDAAAAGGGEPDNAGAKGKREREAATAVARANARRQKRQLEIAEKHGPRELSFYADASQTVAGLEAQLRAELGLESSDSRPLRLCLEDISRHYIDRVFRGDDLVQDVAAAVDRSASSTYTSYGYGPSTIIRVEPVPEDQVAAHQGAPAEGSRLVQIVHMFMRGRTYMSSGPQLHGYPFFLAVGPEDTISNVRGRIGTMLGYSAATLAKYRSSLLQKNQPGSVQPLLDVTCNWASDEVPLFTILKPGWMFGINDEEKDDGPVADTFARSTRFAEKSIKIYN